MIPVSLFASMVAATMTAPHANIEQHTKEESITKPCSYNKPTSVCGAGQDPAAINVATYIVHYSLKQGDLYNLHRFKLHKLMYFVQAASMLITNKPMFNAKIEAWDFGPVVPDIYNLPGKFTSLEMSYCGFKCHPETWNNYTLKKEQKEIIEHVVDNFLPYTYLQMNDIIRNQTPWKNAQYTYSKEITPQALYDYFNQ